MVLITYSRYLMAVLTNPAVNNNDFLRMGIFMSYPKLAGPLFFNESEKPAIYYRVWHLSNGVCNSDGRMQKIFLVVLGILVARITCSSFYLTIKTTVGSKKRGGGG